MEIALSILCPILVVINIGLYLQFSRSNKNRQALKLEKSVLQEKNETFNKISQEQNNKIKSLEEQNYVLVVYKGRFEEAANTISYLKSQNEQEKEKLELLNNKAAESEKQKELFKFQQENLQKERQEWHKEKEVILHKLAADMMLKNEELINKNNQKQNEFSKKQQEELEIHSQHLHKNFEEIWKGVNALNKTVKENDKAISLTHNALLNPQGANNTSEITLENLLKNSGLKQKYKKDDSGDFILQSGFTDSKNSQKIPDAMVFLPNNQILIIDSKSSEHFLGLQQAINNSDTKIEKEIMLKIKESMKRHLESLKKKNYAKSKLEELTKLAECNMHNISELNTSPTIITIMFLQTEKMLEIITKADNSLIVKAREANILIASPIGLTNLLSQSKFIIDRLKQEQNIEEIKKKIKNIIDSIYRMGEKSDAIGKSITVAVNKYNDFAGTFRRTVGYAKKVRELGIESDKKNFEFRLKNIGIDDDSKIIEQTPSALELAEG